MPLLDYFIQLKAGKIVLWCYLIWYLVLAERYFDPAPAIWLNACGISVVIGIALWLGIRSQHQQPERWQVLRMFMTPFCVSSFSALIKGKGFILVFPPEAGELCTAAGACLIFVLLVGLCKLIRAKKSFN